MKKHLFSLVALPFLLCTACQTAELPVPLSPTPVQAESATPAPTPEPITEPTPDPVPVDVTLGYWETNSFRLSDGLIYQFKDDGSYDSWHMNGAFAPSGRYTYEDWILVLQDNIGQEADRFYYALETGQFVSTITKHVVDQEHVDSNGVLIPARFETTTLTCHETPTAPNPYGEVVPSTVSVDISNPAMYRKLNIFLSNFSEVYFPTSMEYSSSFYIENPDDSALASFAFSHALLNNPSLIEDCYVYVGNDFYANSCISASNMQQIVQRFFGISFDPSKAGMSYRDGYYYGYKPDVSCGYGFTLVDSVTDLGGNRFDVQFHIYTAPYVGYPTYDASSTSDIYSAYPDSLPQSYSGDPFTAFYGSAEVEAHIEADGALSFELRRFASNY